MCRVAKTTRCDLKPHADVSNATKVAFAFLWITNLFIFLSRLEWRATFPGEKRTKDDKEKKYERLPLQFNVPRQLSPQINKPTSVRI